MNRNTYALPDNAGHDGADRVLPEYSIPRSVTGCRWPRKVNETTAFKIKAFAPDRWLLWVKAGPRGEGCGPWSAATGPA